MNDGLRILLERMETHPEEFVVAEGIPAKWDNLIRSYEAILDLEDITLFKQARSKLLQQQFTEKVMEELIDPKLLNPYLVQPSATRLGTQIPAFTTSADIQLQAQQKLQAEHIKAHVKALETEKPHKTLFGKLFNYA